MKITCFEDILSWQKTQDLAIRIYEIFAGLKDYDFGNQIRSAVVSVSNNIAEGFERSSDADFVRMLYIAKGSAGEVRSMIYLAFRLNYISQKQKPELLLVCNEISRLITALIKSISSKGRGTGPNLRLLTNDY